MATLHIEVTAQDYTRSHGHAPRGTGSWAFRIVEAAKDTPLLWTTSLPYAKACTAAKAQVRALQAAGVIPASVARVTIDAQS